MARTITGLALSVWWRWRMRSWPIASGQSGRCCSLCSRPRRARIARVVLHGGAPVAAAGDDARDDQLRYDRRNETASPQTDGLIEVPADTTNRLNLIGALYSPDYDRIVKKQNQYVGLTLDDRFDHESALNVFFRSDQFPFVLHNVPAFWWFTGFHPDYHHTTDTADRINYVKMAKILRLAYLTAFEFAGDTASPKFVESPQGR